MMPSFNSLFPEILVMMMVMVLMRIIVTMMVAVMMMMTMMIVAQMIFWFKFPACVAAVSAGCHSLAPFSDIIISIFVSITFSIIGIIVSITILVISITIFFKFEGVM